MVAHTSIKKEDLTIRQNVTYFRLVTVLPVRTKVGHIVAITSEDIQLAHSMFCL